jgi:hypothetical protein
MSQENVEIVRRASEAIARGDIEDMLAYDRLPDGLGIDASTRQGAESRGVPRSG